MSEFAESTLGYLRAAFDLMNEFGFAVRDTFSFSFNHDDHFVNNGQVDGQRRLTIEWTDAVQFSQMSGKKYPVSGRQSVAYDSYTIKIAARLQGANRIDAIVHEVVHFLQHNTDEDDRRYLKFNGANYLQYATQRTEFEAHIVQIVYIARTLPEWLHSKLTAEQITKLFKQIEDYGRTREQKIGVRMILEANASGLI